MIDAYKPGIDVTLLDENLKRTVEERFRGLEAMTRLHEAARLARERGGVPGSSGPASGVVR